MSPLFFPAHIGDLNTLNMLLQKGADANIPDCVGWLLLHFAAQGGHTNIAEALITVKTDVISQAHKGESPLCVATEQGNADHVTLLMIKGAYADWQT